MNVLNLPNHPLTIDEITILSMGLGFYPDSGLDKCIAIKDLHFFARKLIFKTLYHKQEIRDEGLEVLQSPSKRECQALKELLTMEEDPPHLQPLH